MFKKIGFCLIVLFSSLFLFSCATKVRVNMTRPAEIDLNGAETIAVLPFKYDSYFSSLSYNSAYIVDELLMAFNRSGPDEKKVLAYIKTQLEDGLSSSPYIRLVSASAVQSALKSNSLNPADIYVTGQCTKFDVRDEKDISKRKVRSNKVDKDGNPIYRYELIEKFTRNVDFSFRYQVVDSSSSRILYTDSFSLNRSSNSFDNPKNLPDTYRIIQSGLSNQINKILKKLQPYNYTKTIKLLECKTKNESFKYAENLADDGYLKESYEAFRNLYENESIVEAGYNAAMLQMAMGNLYSAKNEMQDLYAVSQSEEILSALNDIKNEIRLSEKLKEQTQKSEVLDFD